jgi:hypothetical protein
MDHAMTVCADKGEILQTRMAAAYCVEWHYVMTLYVAASTVPVLLLEIEAAYLASDGSAVASHGFDLSLPKSARSFARHMKTD